MNVMLRMRNQLVFTVFKARYVTAPTLQFPHFLVGIHASGPHIFESEHAEHSKLL